MKQLQGVITKTIYQIGTEADLHKWLTTTYPNFENRAIDPREQVLPDPMRIVGVS